MKDFGKGFEDNQTLMRIVISRSEIDLVQIKTAFEDMYKKTLDEFISVCF